MVWDCNYGQIIEVDHPSSVSRQFFVVSITSWPRTMSGEGAVRCFGVWVELGVYWVDILEGFVEITGDGVFLDIFCTCFVQNIFPNTPQETNMAPENRPLEKEIPIGNHQF